MEQPEKLTEEERNQRITELKAELAELEKPPHNDWHSWFHALLNITLHRFLDRIKIETEHVLGVEPPRADFLILTEEDDLDPGLEIFRIFRKHKELYGNNLYNFLRINLRECPAKTGGIAGYVEDFCRVLSEI